MEKHEPYSLPSSSKRSLSSAPNLEIEEGIETHEEKRRRVAEFGGKSTGKDTSGQERVQKPSEEERLLWNKLSQEEKEVYLIELDKRTKAMEKAISEVEVMLYNMKNENQMLRDSLMNTTGDSREKDLENSTKDIEKRISDLQEILFKLRMENQMFRDSLMNSTGQMSGASGSTAESGL